MPGFKTFLAAAVALACLACLADAFALSLTLRSPAAAGGIGAVQASGLRRAQAGGVRGLALSTPGGNDDKESVLKKLASIDNERASPRKVDENPPPPFPEWAYIVMPILGVASAFVWQLTKSAS